MFNEFFTKLLINVGIYYIPIGTHHTWIKSVVFNISLTKYYKESNSKIKVSFNSLIKNNKLCCIKMWSINNNITILKYVSTD